MFQFIEIVASLYGLYTNAGATPVLALRGDEAEGGVLVAAPAPKGDHATRSADATPKIDRLVIPDCSFFITPPSLSWLIDFRYTHFRQQMLVNISGSYFLAKRFSRPTQARGTRRAKVNQHAECIWLHF
ncbi:hypothetical protein LFL97_10585 [Burkholderia sp. JSH-S8]|uniref:hypothetical protein n=1 Tax=Burkholderia stagnalis TaxID=1503054 RepID=UPI0013DFD4C2|nr:hypothetical protein [Burkholderia stagnalis]WGS40199.1 hypothetical protein LFL97_10585 [Burkholderia sp. JSH-S8]